jgi:hypothetical protein
MVTLVILIDPLWFIMCTGAVGYDDGVTDGVGTGVDADIDGVGVVPAHAGKSTILPKLSWTTIGVSVVPYKLTKKYPSPKL